MALSKITAASITDNSITNTQINSSAAIAKTKLASLDIVNADVNASAAIAATKLGTMATANMPVGSVLQVKHMWNDNQYAYAVTSSGNDFLDTGNFTTLGTNSTFHIVITINHGVGGEDNNMDGHDTHFFCMRSANSTHVYVGNNNNLDRTTGNSPGSGKFYSTDVPFSSERGRTPSYGNSHDTYHRCMTTYDSPSLAAGVTNRYRVRMFNQATAYINRSRGSTSSGGTSGIMVMEIQT